MYLFTYLELTHLFDCIKSWQKDFCANFKSKTQKKSEVNLGLFISLLFTDIDTTMKKIT